MLVAPNHYNEEVHDNKLSSEGSEDENRPPFIVPPPHRPLRIYTGTMKMHARTLELEIVHQFVPYLYSYCKLLKKVLMGPKRTTYKHA